MANTKNLKDSQSFLEGKSFKKFMQKLYGWGASVVILGALFKIQHWPLAGFMLTVGLGTEAIIFFISAFDTQKEVVARAAVAAGASVINDVSCTLIEVAGELGVGYVAMHRQGTAETMQVNPTYEDVVSEIAAFLRVAATRAKVAGVSKLWLDPGIGFGKTVEHNVALLAHVETFVSMAQEYGAGVLMGTSRKRFLESLGKTSLSVDERLEGSIATEAWAMLKGVSMVRVHDAEAAVQLRELLVRRVQEVVA